jgi:competence protein ComEC
LIISEKNEVNADIYSLYGWREVFLSWRSQIWQDLSQPVLQTLPYPHSVVLLSMIFGEQEEVGEQTNTLFKITGTSHIQAVSGYNFAVITAGIQKLIATRLSKRKQGMIILLAALIFFCIVGVQPSVVRAVASLITVLTARFLLMRQAKAPFCLVIVLYFLLFWKPLWLFSISFQLSVASVVGILFIQPILEHKLESILSQCTQKSATTRQLPFLITEVVGGFTTAVAASLTTAPLLLCYFHELPLIGIGISAVFASLLNLIVSCGFWTTLTAGLIYNSFLQGFVTWQVLRTLAIFSFLRLD